MIPPIDKWTEEEIEEEEIFRRESRRPKWFKFFYGDWYASTAMFDDDQCGWYITLLSWAASEGDPPGYLPDDDDELKQIARFRDLPAAVLALQKLGSNIPPEYLDKLREIRERKWKQVIKKFTPTRAYPGMVRNRKLVEVLKEAHNKIERLTKLGQEAVKQRWNNYRREKELEDNSVEEDEPRRVRKDKPLRSKELIPKGIENGIEKAIEPFNLDLSSGFNTEKIVSEKEIDPEESEVNPLPLELEGIDLIPDLSKKKRISTYESRVRIGKQAKEVFEFWKQDHPSAKFGPDRRSKVEARLREGYTTEQLKEAVLGNKESPFHAGENPDSKKYQDLELICRKGSKVEEFIAVHRKYVETGGKRNEVRLNTKQQQSRFEAAADRNARLEREEVERTKELLSGGS